jgi:hypothetical protein
MGSGPVKFHSSHLRRMALVRVLLWMAVVILLAGVAIAVPAWWAAVPLLSLAGFLSWRSRILWGPLVGGLLGFGYWVALLLLLPARAVSRLSTALAGVMGLSPPLVEYLGPLLFAIVSALAALAVAYWGRLGLGGTRLGVPGGPAPPR